MGGIVGGGMLYIGRKTLVRTCLFLDIWLLSRITQIQCEMYDDLLGPYPIHPEWQQLMRPGSYDFVCDLGRDISARLNFESPDQQVTVLELDIDPLPDDGKSIVAQGTSKLGASSEMFRTPRFQDLIQTSFERRGRHLEASTTYKKIGQIWICCGR